MFTRRLAELALGFHDIESHNRRPRSGVVRLLFDHGGRRHHPNVPKHERSTVELLDA